ncbi:MAG: hypothetical protein QOF48_2645 [Verrucomicrobiota bacterium]|jgi:glycine/D-amino acid oxidase-like deaminating enzyme
MKLKSGNLYWPKHTEPPPQGETLRRDIRCDVVVIGAGLSGALTAYMLACEGLDVVILDKRNTGQGSTSASTALILYDIDVSLIDLIRQRGREAAVRSYRYCLETISTLRNLVAKLGDRCEFTPRPSLYLASEAGDVPDLKQEFKARRKFGLPVEFFAPADIAERFSFNAPAALYSTEAAEINPLRLARQLTGAARERGSRLFVRTQSSGIRETARRVEVRTRSGHLIEARWAVVATGYETLARKARQVLKLKSSYALVTDKVRDFPGWHERCVIWETARPYVYLRTTADDRIMIGGGDEPTRDARTRDRLIGRKTAMLQQKLREFFPLIHAAPAYSWAGMFGESKDGLPYIGSTRANSRILYALCYGANGTNFSVMAAEILRDAILNRPNADACLFQFDR